MSNVPSPIFATGADADSNCYARISTPRLAALVRPSGYFRQKAKKLKAFVRFLRDGYGGSLKGMFLTPTSELREKLLSVHGIGPETADSILLYAGNHPVFVVDAYTHRILGRHGITHGKPDYEKVRAFIEASIPSQVELFNEFHALIVNTGKNWCRKSVPRCQQCPLRPLLPANSPHSPLTEIAPDAALRSREHGVSRTPQIATFACRWRSDNRAPARGSLHARLA